MTLQPLLAMLAVALALALTIRGGRLVARRDEVLPMVGAAACLTGVLAVVAAFVVTAPDAVLARELQLLLFDRAFLRIPVQLLLIGAAVLAALVWHVARLSAACARRGELILLLPLGLSVGTVAALNVRPLGGAASGVVWAYDLLEPALLLWLTVALTGTALTALRFRRSGTRLVVEVAAVAAVVALHRWLRGGAALWIDAFDASLPLPLPFVDPGIKQLWIASVPWVRVAGLIAAAALVATHLLLRRERRVPAPDDASGASADDAGNGENGDAPLWRKLVELAMVAATPLALNLALAYETPLGVPLIGLGVLLVVVLEPARAPSLLGLMLVAASLLGLLFDPFGLGGVLSLLLFVVGAVVLLEVLARRHGAAPEREVAALAELPRRTADAGRRVGSWLAQLLAFRTFGQGALKLAVAALLVLIVAEIPFDDAIRVEEFTVDATLADEAVDPATVRGALLVELRELRSALWPRDFLFEADAASSSRGGLGALLERGAAWVPYAPLADPRRGFAEGADFEAIGRDTTFGWGGTEVPLGVLVEPFRRPLQRLFGTRSVRGHVSYEAGGDEDAGGEEGQGGGAWTVWLRGAGIAPIAARAERLDDAVAAAARELLRATDDRAGMVPSEAAFGPFLEAIAVARSYARTGDPAELASALELLARALERDPGFALGAYRAGQLLQRAGEADLAESALRRAAATPDLPLATNALAHLVASAGDGAGVQLAASGGPAGADRLAEAQARWRALLRDPGDRSLRFSAAAGLCRAARAASGDGVVLAAEQVQLLVIHYHCARSYQRFLGLPAAVRANATTVGAATESLTGLVFSLDWLAASLRPPREREVPTELWCLPLPLERTETASGGADVVRASFPPPVYARATRRYRRTILALAPNDGEQRCWLQIDRYLASGERARGAGAAPAALGHELRRHRATESWRRARDYERRQARVRSAYGIEPRGGRRLIERDYRQAAEDYAAVLAALPNDSTARLGFALSVLGLADRAEAARVQRALEHLRAERDEQRTVFGRLDDAVGFAELELALALELGSCDELRAARAFARTQGIDALPGLERYRAPADLYRRAGEAFLGAGCPPEPRPAPDVSAAAPPGTPDPRR